MFAGGPAVLGVAGYVIPVLHAIQPLEGVPPFIENRPVQIRWEFPVTACLLSVTPHIVGAVILRQ